MAILGEVRASRLAAWLAPCRSDEEAQAALVAAACGIEAGDG